MDITIQAFWIAVEAGRTQLALELFKLPQIKTQVNQVQLNNGLYGASKSKNLLAFKSLLACGGSVDCIGLNDKRTCLHWACAHGNKELVSLILDYSINNCFVYDLWGEAPLHCAVKNGNIECVKLLVEYGICNPGIEIVKTNFTDDRNVGKTALDIAKEEEHREIEVYIKSVTVNTKTFGIGFIIFIYVHLCCICVYILNMYYLLARGIYIQVS